MKSGIFRKLIKIQQWLDSVEFLTDIALTPNSIDLKTISSYIGTTEERWPFLRVNTKDGTIFTIQSKANPMGGISFWLNQNIGGIAIGVSDDNTIRLASFIFALDSIASLNTASRNAAISIGFNESTHAAYLLYCTPIPNRSLMCKNGLRKFFRVIREDINSHLLAVQTRATEKYYTEKAWEIGEDEEEYDDEEYDDDEPTTPS